MTELSNLGLRSHLGGLSTVPLIPSICLLLLLAAAYYSRSVPSTEVALWVVFLSASISNIAGFAFSPIAGAVLFRLNPDPVPVVQWLLVASIAQQLYCVWRLRSQIISLEFLPYVVGSLLTLPFGVLLLLKSQASIFLPLLGFLLLAYGVFTAIKPTFKVRNTDSLAGRILVGALGGLTGGLAAFPGASVAIWCQFQGFDKDRQRSIVQPFILVSQIAAITILSLARPTGGSSLEVIQYAAPAVLGAYVGLHIFKKLSTSNFNRIVGAALAIAGILMAVKPIQLGARPATITVPSSISAPANY